MSEDLNKKINIDIEVNADGQQQINQYKAALISLQSAIVNLGKPLTDLSKSSTSFNNDLSKMTDAAVKNADKMTAASKKSSTQQADINAALNKNLKASLSEAGKIQLEAVELVIKNKSEEYASLTLLEDNSYNDKKKSCLMECCRKN